MAVEKPHVKTYFRPKSKNGVAACSDEFKHDFTKSHWLKTLKMAMQDAIASNSLNPKRIIVAGHSEGAEVAAYFAGENTEVSHVLMGGGGGAVQLYEFVFNAVKVARIKDKDGDAESRAVTDTLDGWKKMAHHPNAITPLYMGHTPRYWTTFKTISSAEVLKKSNAKVYIMNGTEDDSAPVTSSDLLAAELTVAGKTFVYDRILGANHSFVVNGQDKFDQIWSKAFQWALQ